MGWGIDVEERLNLCCCELPNVIMLATEAAELRGLGDTKQLSWPAKMQNRRLLSEFSRFDKDFGEVEARRLRLRL